MNNQTKVIDAKFEIGLAMENLGPWAVMTMLGENTANHAVPVVWAFNDVAENWTGRDTFIHNWMALVSVVSEEVPPRSPEDGAGSAAARGC